jgi:hypothetical protein
VLSMLLAFLALSSARAQAPVPLRTISSLPSCSKCSIELDVVATLAPPVDSLSFGIQTKLTRLSNGTFVVWGLNETKSPVLFDPAGRFSRVLARRGQGPGELSSVDMVVAGPGDTIWVVAGGRKNIFAPSGTFVRTQSLVQVDDLLWFTGGPTVIAAMNGSAERAGYPLHLLDGAGRITRSFGVDKADLDPRSFAATGDDASSYMSRFLTRGANRTFWVSSQTRFLLEQYDLTGRLLNQGRHALDGWYGDFSERAPGAGEFKGGSIGILQESSTDDLLWLVYHDRNASFVRAGMLSKPLGEISRMFDMIIEAVDARTLQLLATRRFPATSTFGIQHTPDLLAWTVPLDDVFHTLRVTRLRLVRSP